MQEDIDPSHVDIVCVYCSHRIFVKRNKFNRIVARKYQDYVKRVTSH